MSVGDIGILACSDQETAKLDALVAKVREAIEHFKELSVALVSAAVTAYNPTGVECL